ncbi:MAG: homoserine kinase, partial [Butyricicoccus sp.]|nr:homoserine kinase [Butyricicoccus sp.]
MKVQVKVPATSANMGSGYDSIGIALDLYNTITLEECDHIDITDVNGQDIPTDESNLIYQCAKKIYDICGKPLSGLRIVEDCNIPQTRGLGSSSACTVAGILGANALLGNPLDQENIIDLAASIEGHPDNSTPAILGGFCVALLEYGKVWSVRVPMNGTVDFITFIPDFELSTEKARAVLPKTIDHHDAVFNLARAALLAGSLTTGKLENLGVAVGDCL